MVQARTCHCYACEREGQHEPWCLVHDAALEERAKAVVRSEEGMAMFKHLSCDCGQREGKRQKIKPPHADTLN